MIDILILFVITLVALNICHWMGDFTHLSTAWMLNAKWLGKPIGPIFAHALVHATLMFLVVLILHGYVAAVITYFIQLITHFLIDLLKGRLNGWFPKLQDIKNKFHWWVFGGDQFAHQMVIIGTAFLIFLLK